MRTVIITGASSGLGREFFVAAAKRYPDSEFWLIARRADRLASVASLSPETKTRLLSLDLASDDGLNEFSRLLESEKPDIRLLINNAGFGKLGYVASLSPQLQRDMVSLNCGSLTFLCSEALRFMQSGSGIINIASIAAFAPNPRMTVYSSTKAYVLAFSKGLREETRKNGINVLAVCPGPMRTEFLGVADITDENSKTFRTLPYCSAPEVASRSLERSDKGCAVYTNRLFFKFYRVLAKLLPHSFVMKFSKC